MRMIAVYCEQRKLLDELDFLCYIYKYFIFKRFAWKYRCPRIALRGTCLKEGFSLLLFHSLDLKDNRSQSICTAGNVHIVMSQYLSPADKYIDRHKVSLRLTQ